MNKNKLAGMLFYIAAICFYAAAIYAGLGSHDSSLTAVWISMGTVMIVLGATSSKKE